MSGKQPLSRLDMADKCGKRKAELSPESVDEGLSLNFPAGVSAFTDFKTIYPIIRQLPLPVDMAMFTSLGPDELSEAIFQYLFQALQAFAFQSKEKEALRKTVRGVDGRVEILEQKISSLVEAVKEVPILKADLNRKMKELEEVRKENGCFLDQAAESREIAKSLQARLVATKKEKEEMSKMINGLRAQLKENAAMVGAHGRGAKTMDAVDRTTDDVVDD